MIKTFLYIKVIIPHIIDEN